MDCGCCFNLPGSSSGTLSRRNKVGACSGMCTRFTSKFEEIHELFVLDAPFGAGIAAIFLEKRAEVPSLDFVDICDKYA